LWMLPTQLKEFSQSLMAVSFFSSNILFWLQTEYFATAAKFKPLLHTWSLAVEEQYYLFFPLLIVFIRRFGRQVMLALLAVLWLASFLLMQWGAGVHPGATFYLMPTRLWEILTGSFLAFRVLYKGKVQFTSRFLVRWGDQIFGALGLLLILTSIFTFDEKTFFTGLYGLMPIMGTALVILFASERTLAGAILANKLVVGVGLISYSAYLWHHPLFAFARIRSAREPGFELMLGLSFLCLVLAYLTWKYIEKPFRDRSKVNRRQIFQFAGSVVLAVVSLGAVGYLNHGFENRTTPSGISLAQIEMNTKFTSGLDSQCSYSTFMTLKSCRTSDEPEIAVWGDSFAMHLIPGILASNPDVKMIQMTKAYCGPILGIAPMNSERPISWAKECVAFNDNVIAWLKENPYVRYVVISSPFDQYFDQSQYIQETGTVVAVSDEMTVLNHFEDTLAVLTKMGVQPVIFAPPPSDGQDIATCLVITAYEGRKADECRIKVNAYHNHQKEVIAFLKAIGEKYSVIWFDDMLCDSEFCKTEMDGVFLYADQGHFSIGGSQYIGKKMNFYSLIGLH